MARPRLSPAAHEAFRAYDQESAALVDVVGADGRLYCWVPKEKPGTENTGALIAPTEGTDRC